MNSTDIYVSQPDALEREIGVGEVRLVDLGQSADPQGSLVVGEFDSFPFTPCRFFSVYGVPAGNSRGEHAHLVCEQLLVAVHGSVRCLVDDGSVRREIVLDSPRAGLYVPARIWGRQHDHSPDAVLLVLASLPFDDGDYVRGYEDFLRIVVAQT